MVKIFDSFFRQRKRYFSRKPVKQDIGENEAIGGIKTELDEHLDAINENTVKIQTIYDYINELSLKIEKIVERLERIELFLQSDSNFILEEKTFEVKPLTKTEQHVFLVIYALDNESDLVSYADVCRKTGLPIYVVSEYIARLVEKGIPLIKKYVNNIVYIKLNPGFKSLHAKENLVAIDTAQKELFNFD